LSLWQGKRQEAKGKSEEGLGDFTLLYTYTVWFYCVHLLSTARRKSKVKSQKSKVKSQNEDSIGFWRI